MPSNPNKLRNLSQDNYLNQFDSKCPYYEIYSSEGVNCSDYN